MRLRNKKTGELGIPRVAYQEFYIDTENSTKRRTYCYKTLDAMYCEWEDYKKQCWYITSTGEVREGILDADWRDERRIGNYFESKEEAEKALEKLKAWKRLKDKGFVWQDWEEGAMGNGMCVIVCQIPENNWETDVVEDLDLLFGGEGGE